MSWNIARTLAQDKVWVTQDGRVMLISEMAQEHRQNTHAYLLRRAQEIHNHVRWLRIRETIHGLRIADPRQLEGVRMHFEIEMDPEKWLRATPFMVELERAIRAHGVEDGEVVDVRYEEWIDGASRRLIS